MEKIKKFFGNINLTWKTLIIFAIIAGVSIGIVILLFFGFLTLHKPQVYDTEILTNGASQEAKRRKYTINKQVKESKQEDKIDMIKLKVNNRELEVKLEDNETTKELVEKLKNEDIKVKANEYGGFEKVGNLGFNLPKNDTYITTSAGDIVLYQGNQISLFYNSNSWNYTRIGKIQNISESELKKLLGTEEVEMTLGLN